MEAASPTLELLADLPVEEPLDVAPLTHAPRAAAVSGADKPVASAQDSERAGLDFVDPEMFLAPGQETSFVLADPAPAVAHVSDETFELTLEDPIVDELLSAPPPAASAPLPVSVPAAAPSARAPAANLIPLPVPPPVPQRTDASATARVPILKTPSLAAAASKVAAASAAIQRAKLPVPAPRPATPPPVPPANAAELAPPRAVPAGSAQAAKPEVPAASAPAAPRVLVPAARPMTAPPSAPLVPAAFVPQVPAVKAAPVAAVPLPPLAVAPPAEVPETPAAPSTPPMDQDFIARNQVVERYLSGRLPVKGATDFERFCKEHPEVLDEIGLPERVNAGLRLLDASGKPEPWQENSRPAWRKPQLTLALAAVIVVLAVALAVITGGSLSKTHRITDLEKEVHDRVLDAATSTRDIRLLPSRTGASNVPAITIGGVGAGAQLADFRIDESRSPYHAFKVTIDRVDQGRVGAINNLNKDSNGHLRIALNSSALGPGTYQLTLEGLDWRGEPQPDSWVTIGISR
jgi:hypothetical protein